LPEFRADAMPEPPWDGWTVIAVAELTQHSRKINPMNNLLFKSFLLHVSINLFKVSIYNHF
jgi:hypothetical protein